MAQAYNKYVPPELEGTKSANSVTKRRAPGTLKKDGTQTVRFEMPFAIWCHTCRPHAIIGQGVRFNAEKKKVGMYHSTPIWSFRMKHPACTGVIEIRTDPKNTAYIVTEGAKARDYGDPDDSVREGTDGVPILTAEERQQRREDAFSQLEGRNQDEQHTKDNAKRVAELYEARDRDWDDPWTANKRMRRTFREERKAIQRADAADQSLKDRIGTSMDLLPETEEDAVRAKLATFEGNKSVTQQRTSNRKPNPAASKTPKPTDLLRRRLLSNTRTALDPFDG